MPTLIENEFTFAALYSTPSRAFDTCSVAPTIACAPSTCSSSRFTAAVFSWELERYVEPPTYGDTAAHFFRANLRLASRSTPYTLRSRSSGPYIDTKLARTAAAQVRAGLWTRACWTWAA